MSEWHELAFAHYRVRWRHDGEEHAWPAAGYEIQTDSLGEWRDVANTNSRDWFAIGMMARGRISENLDLFDVPLAPSEE